MHYKIPQSLMLSGNRGLRKKFNYLSLALLMNLLLIPNSDIHAEVQNNTKYKNQNHVSLSGYLQFELEVFESKIIVKDTSNSKSKNQPRWVEMMNDPNVNYYEAKKEFTEYWEARGKIKLREEDKIRRTLIQRIIKSDKKLAEENHELLLPYKRFKKWLVDMEPYVQPDGSILSIEEQKKIWENARK